ncbi:MAG: LysM peptidoglycan-binding domain-containing protein [Chloroflexi bacterium]|nr:LysM peptidoglycan-binding domain-containing protein [Chloroflexota bacterium]MCL5275921.1 LysM peptidoglycan-binding domain-containing protein [Chloroflexota bacterium]
MLLLQTTIPSQVSAQDSNTLFNEGFEGNFVADPYCTTGTCNVPEGWGVWFIPRRDTDPPGINFQPEYTRINTANRVKSGSAAQRVATENATFTGGIFKIVNNVKIGSKLRFTVWGQSWSTNDESPISARPSTDIKLKIGIDPMGGSNGQASPLNGQVVWSDEQDAKDAYAQFSVETEAKSQTVIVYLYATMKDPVRHNEVYWDDAVLEYSAPPPTATVTPTLPTTAEPGATTASQNTTSTPAAASPTVQPTNGITYTVQEGDTLYDIAVKYNKSVEGIKRLNGLSSDLLSIGQVLIIEPAAVATAAVTVQPTQILTATATPGTGALCVQAYFDNNGNGVRDTGEDLVPNVLFNVSAKGAAVKSYTSDGKNEPYCMRNLSASAYTVAAIITPAYVATTPLNDTVNVPGGAAAQFAVGLRRVSDGNQVVGPTETPQGAQSSGNSPNILAILATIGGALIILVTIGFGVLFFMHNWKM